MGALPSHPSESQISLPHLQIEPAPLLFPFRKRKRRSDVVVVRGRLRLYSASGFFLLLGLVILAAGIGMATLGYWPHREAMPLPKTQTGGSKTTAAGAGGGEKNTTRMSPSAANLSTSDSLTGELLLPIPGCSGRYHTAHLLRVVRT